MKPSEPGFDMLAAGSTLWASINRVQCGLRNNGSVCVDLIGSLAGGGLWPAGSPNAYIFASGVQVAGIIPSDAPVWAGDTVGVFFYDARRGGWGGRGLTSIYSSLDPEDVAEWPNGAVVRDPQVYARELLGRASVSQEDSWVRYWDRPGEILLERDHPMGILVEQRSLAWTYPSGNEDILYFVYTFYNVTASDPAIYADLDPAIRDEIAEIGSEWGAEIEGTIGVSVPPEGYRIDSVYAAFISDPDIVFANNDAATTILPFNMGLAYDGTFWEPGWQYPIEINGPPFGPYPGLHGVKYLQSPIDPATGEQVGLTLFSTTQNPGFAGAGITDPVGSGQLWRTLSGNLSPAWGDKPCTEPNPKESRLCGLQQDPTDTRFFQASGPFSLDPGEAISIVVAYLFAAPVAAPVMPYIQGFLRPGYPANGRELAADASLVRDIERVSGWVSQSDANGDGAIEEGEVTVVERSLLDKAIVAQGVYDAGFLLPFAPEAPDFFLVPGDNNVTVVWQPSATENIGDPYFDIAGDPGNALYDPNYRQYDVEGYRIYRGRTRAQLELVAQFDYAGTTFVDYTGAWAYSGRCAPELGILDDCPTFPEAHELLGDISQVPPGGRVELAGGNFREVEDANVGAGDGTATPAIDDLTPIVVPTTVTITTGSQTVTDDGAGGFTGDGTGTIDYTTGAVSIQWNGAVGDGTTILASYSYTIPAGSGEVLITSSVNPVEDADCGGGVNCPALSNTGVPFAHIDNAVVNSVTYYYAVSAFDVNSIASAGSLESALISKSVTPRAPAPNLSSADVVAGLYGRGQLLDQAAAFTFDGATGTFTGSPPPTGLLRASYELFAPTALKAGAVVELTIDSIQPSYYEGEYWMTLDIDGQTSQFYFIGMPISSSDIPAYGRFDPIPGSIPSDPALAAQTGNAGLPFAGQAVFAYSVDPVTFYSGDVEWHLDVDGAFWDSDDLTGLGGSRWFSGEDESTTYDGSPYWRGALDGVTAIQSPQPNWSGAMPEGSPTNYVYALFRRIRQSTWHAARQADVKFYWGATAGTLDSVIDVTHNVPITFDDGQWGGSGWGFRDDITGIGTSPSAPDGVITEYDFTQGPCWSPLNGGLPSHSTGGCDTRPFLQGAVLQPVDINGDGAAEGNGFALYFDHEFYIFQTDALPSGTVWTHRSYFGKVDGSSGAWTFAAEGANPAVPGLTSRVEVVAPAAVQDVTEENLANVHTVPDPYYATNGLEIAPSQKILKFVNLPERAIIRIYSVSGVLVDIIEHNDPGLGGEATWDVRNRNNQTVASGVYFYHVETPSGAETIGRMTVVTSSNIVPLGNR